MHISFLPSSFFLLFGSKLNTYIVIESALQDRRFVAMLFVEGKKIGININIPITIKQEYDTLLHEFTN